MGSCKFWEIVPFSNGHKQSLAQQIASHPLCKETVKQSTTATEAVSMQQQALIEVV